MIRNRKNDTPHKPGDELKSKDKNECKCKGNIKTKKLLTIIEFYNFTLFVICSDYRFNIKDFGYNSGMVSSIKRLFGIDVCVCGV